MTKNLTSQQNQMDHHIRVDFKDISVTLQDTDLSCFTEQLVNVQNRIKGVENVPFPGSSILSPDTAFPNKQRYI